MNIAFVGLRGVPAAYSGIERAVEEIGARLAGQGHEVTVYCMASRYQQRPAWYRGMRLRYVPAIRGKNLEMITYSFLASCSSALRSHDVVHFHALGPSTMAFIPRLLRKPTVVTVHGLDWERSKWGRLARAYLKWGETASWRFAHRTIVVSKELRRHYRQAHGCDAAYIPNGVGHYQYTPLDGAGRQFSLGRHEYLLFVGRLTREKNVDMLIRAFRRIDTPMKLVILGGSGEGDDYADYLQELASGDSRVLFTGPLYGPLMAQIAGSAFLLVLPSAIEGLAVTLLESLAQGVPALVSDIPPNLEIIRQENSELGFSFPAGDLAALETTLRRLVEHPDLVERKRGLGIELLRREYDWDRIAEQTLAVYESVCNRTLST